MGLATQTDGVTIAIARDPALVRTARLVAAAVARRADRPDTVIEAVRLAVGEACAVMIGVDEPPTRVDPAERVEVTLRNHEEAFAVTVSGSIAAPDPSFEGIDLDPWALLRGISDELTISSDGAVTTVRMSWPS
jgi:hypothetical protein